MAAPRRTPTPARWLCYADKEQPLPPDCDPFSVSRRLFSDVMTDPKAAERARLQRRSVLDTVKETFRLLDGK